MEHDAFMEVIDRLITGGMKEMDAGIMPVSEYEKKYSKENSRTLTINENNTVQEEQSAELMLTPTIA